MPQDYASMILRGMDRGSEAFMQRMRANSEASKMGAESLVNLADSLSKIPSLIRKRKEEDDVAGVNDVMSGALLAGGDDQTMAGALAEYQPSTRAGVKAKAEAALKLAEWQQKRRSRIDDEVRAEADRRMRKARQRFIASGGDPADLAASARFAMGEGLSPKEFGLDPYFANERAMNVQGAISDRNTATLGVRVSEGAANRASREKMEAARDEDRDLTRALNADKAEKDRVSRETLEREKEKGRSDRAKETLAFRREQHENDKVEFAEKVKMKKEADEKGLSLRAWAEETEENGRRMAALLRSKDGRLNKALERQRREEASEDPDEEELKAIDEDIRGLEADLQELYGELEKPVSAPKGGAAQPTPADIAKAKAKGFVWNGKKFVRPGPPETY